MSVAAYAREMLKNNSAIIYCSAATKPLLGRSTKSRVGRARQRFRSVDHPEEVLMRWRSDARGSVTVSYRSTEPRDQHSGLYLAFAFVPV
jgi:hypothetical protein